MMHTPLLRIERLTKTYGDLTAVDDVDLSVEAGEIFALLGPNGAGKTTLISCVCGMVQRFTGRVRVAGFDVRDDYPVTRRLVGVVPQELNFDGFFKARKVLAYQAGFFGKRRAKARARRLLEDFRLAEKADANTRWLSGGMKRRLMICKALIHEPVLLFLDEPTAGVDVELRDELWAYVRRLRDEGTTVFLTTHYLEEAEHLADRIAILRDGKLVLLETNAGLKSRFGQRWLEIRFQEAVGDDAVARLGADSVRRLDDRTLRFSYREEPSTLAQSAIEPLLNRIHSEGLRVAAIDGGASSLEDIFRQVMRREQDASPVPFPAVRPNPADN
ncbi:MAG: ABC transporter ATP-binding protein [Opitutales bacterium]|nr:ABC transporter ATP-binding protein [Opitutales bacterium]